MNREQARVSECISADALYGPEQLKVNFDLFSLKKSVMVLVINILKELQRIIL
jgi:hypothetical protein